MSTPKMTPEQAALKATGLATSPEGRSSLFNPLKEALDARRNGTFERDIHGKKFAQAARAFSALVSAPHLLAQAMKKSSTAGEVAAQFFTPSTAMPDFVTRSFDTFREYVNVDDRAMLSFKTRNFDAEREFLEVADVEGGLFLEEIAEGEKVKYGTFNGVRTRFDAVDYGTGVEIPWRMIETRAWSALVDLGQEFGWSVMQLKQRILYALLVDAGNLNVANAVAWPGSGTTLERTIQVINEAATNIADSMKAKTYVDAATAPLNLYVPGGDVVQAQFRSALNHVTNYNSTITDTITSRQINLLPTYNLIAGDGTEQVNKAFMVLPGHKIQYGERVSPTMYTEDDIDSFTTKNTMRMSFAAFVGDIEQVVSIDLA